MKFRVALSLEHLNWILSQESCPPELHKQLSVHAFKASNGLTQPAYEIKSLIPKSRKELSLDDKYLMACKMLEQGRPLPPELQSAYSEYRYLNDLMSDEESAEYEQRELIAGTQGEF